MTRFARAERLALCDTFLAVGPDAPTLCDGWTTADLATHLVIRDGRPDLQIGPMLPLVGGRFKAAARAIKRRPWPQLVDAVRGGPPVYTPVAIGAIDEKVNLVEFFIHHEDVRRPNGDGPRTLPEGEDAALWTALRRLAGLMYRNAATGVELVSGRGTIHARKPTGLGSVTLAGDPGELMLAAYGRQAAAVLEVTGSDEAVTALLGSRVGLR